MTTIGLLVGAALLGGCGPDITVAAQSAGCSEFAVGRRVDPALGASSRSLAAAQAVGDFAAAASSSTDRLIAACRSIAQALDAPKDEQLRIEAAPRRSERVAGWCALAAAAIRAVPGNVTLNTTPSACAVSASANAACQAMCLGVAACDSKAAPPACVGEDRARLEIACRADCTAPPGVPLACDGACRGTCNGVCQSPTGVSCAGKCVGRCLGVLDEEGNCNDNICVGRCDHTSAGTACNGLCRGECAGVCAGTPAAPAKCDGTCTGEFDVLKCWAGELEGGCGVDPTCNAYCNIVVKSKAECREPVVRVGIAPLTERGAQFVVALEQSLPTIYVIDQRLHGLLKAAGGLPTTDVVGDVTPACKSAIGEAAATGLEQVSASVRGAAEVLSAAEARSG